MSDLPTDPPEDDPTDPPVDPPAEDPPADDPPADDPPADDPPADDPPPEDPPVDPPQPPSHMQAITRRVGYGASPVNNEVHRQQIDQDWDEIGFLRFDCGYFPAGRLIIVLMSLGISYPDSPSGFWTFRLYAAEGADENGFPLATPPTRDDADLIDELTFPVTGEPFNPVGVFNFPSQRDYMDLTLWVESHLSEGTGEIHLSAAEPRRMHSSVMAIDSGPI